jgi:hypothetical protein
MTVFLAIIISLAVGVSGGALGAFFVLRNNPKLFNLDKLLKNLRDKYAAQGQTKLDELKNKAKEILS